MEGEFEEVSGKVKKAIDELKNNLIFLQTVVDGLKDEVPFSDNNRKKGLKILQGGGLVKSIISTSPRRALRKIDRNFDTIIDGIDTLSGVLSSDERKAGNKLHDTHEKWSQSELESHKATLLGALSWSSSGQFRKALRGKEYDKISPEDIDKVDKAIAGLMAVIKSTKRDMGWLARYGRSGLGRMKI